MSVNVLSLFNGMSCGMLALEHSGFNVLMYYSAEIDKHANRVTADNYRGIVQLGDVTKWREWDIEWDSIDIILGGFPCQAWSMAGKQLGDKDERGMLFWTMLDIMKHVRSLNPDADFLIENVKMKKEFEEYITYHMENAVGDVHKILINSALVSAQNRNRYYWTSFPVTQPEDRGIVLADIIEIDPESPTIMSEKFCNRNAHILRDDVSGKSKNLSAMEYVKNGHQGDYINAQPTVDGETFNEWHEKTKNYGGTREEFDSLSIKVGRVVGRKINPTTGKRDDYNINLKTEQRVEPRLDDKSGCLTTVQKDNVVVRLKSKCVRSGGVGSPPSSRHNWDNAIDSKTHYRKLTPIECERLQTVPDNFTASVSNTQRYKMLGNGWTVDVISHILSHIRGKYE